MNIFTVPAPFNLVRQDTEFLKNTGDIWRKLGKDEADKVNAPGAGIIIRMPEREIVWLDPLDVPRAFNN